MTAREQAIEAAAKAVFGGLDEVWERNPTEQAHYRRAATAALAAAVPVLLNDLADRIAAFAQPGLMAYDHAAEVVRAAAEGWGA